MRGIPIAIREKVHDKIFYIKELGILNEVDEPTPWVSKMVTTIKKCGDRRICIDPRPLNKALMREHYYLPVLEDILPQLKRAKVFFQDRSPQCILAF